MLLSNPKNGEQYHSISGNLAEYSGKITFSEAKFQKIQDGYQIYCHATTATQLEKFGDKTWKWEPTLLTFAIHDKEWQRNTKVNGEFQKIATKPQTVEVYLCKMFDAAPELYQSPDKAFEGFIKFDAYASDLLLTGVDPQGKPVPDTLIEWIRGETCLFNEVEPKLITTLPAAKKGWGSGGGGGQLMSAQLNDKWDFVCKMLIPYVKEDSKPKNFLDLVLVLQEVKATDPEAYPEIFELVKSILSV